MTDGVAIGVPREPTRIRHVHATDHQAPVVREPVRIVAEPDADGAHAPLGGLAAKQPARPRQVVLGRDLHVVGVSFHDVHPIAELARRARLRR